MRAGRGQEEGSCLEDFGGVGQLMQCLGAGASSSSGTGISWGGRGPPGQVPWDRGQHWGQNLGAGEGTLECVGRGGVHS